MLKLDVEVSSSLFTYNRSLYNAGMMTIEGANVKSHAETARRNGVIKRESDPTIVCHSHGNSLGKWRVKVRLA
jgi:hypothetical protein